MIRDPLETIEVDDSLGRITAEAVFARRSSPSYNAAAMDGIAVHFGDLTGASEAHPVRLDSSRFIPVNTGNAIPDGFNAVVMIEDVHYLKRNRSRAAYARHSLAACANHRRRHCRNRAHPP